uniref:Holliday junction branch migration complex subunit RuvB n=1 Tax=candidate division WOR-3 bacterium TaxID=2052148 RepID=A0A7V5XZT7_UNCW3
MKEKLIAPERLSGEEAYENILRPQTLEDFIGQKKLKENLKIFIEAAKQRKEPLEHVLLFGPSGLGKTTLAFIIAKEMGVKIKAVTGPILERPADLVGILTNLEEKEVLFIDEIHRINHIVEEYLYPALEEFSLDIVIDKGPGARSHRIKLANFTLIGATTRSGLLTAPLRSRFGIVFHLDYYPPEDLKMIVLRSARLLKIDIDDEAAAEIAQRSRGTPRIANRLLRRIRDFAQVKKRKKIDKEIAEYALAQLGIDKFGFDEMDKKILFVLIEKFNGGPVGLQSLAVAIGENPETIAEIYEPFLIKQGFIKRTPRGREATPLAFKYFKKTDQFNQPTFEF